MENHTRTLILIRHAHRDNSIHEKDNGLSRKGKLQADALAEELTALFDLKKAKIYSSPKLRCTETLKPLAKMNSQTIETEPLLVERQENESLTQFKSRIQQTFQKWNKLEANLILACSHGDWLPYAVQMTTGANCEFKKSGWAEISITEGTYILTFRPRQKSS